MPWSLLASTALHAGILAAAAFVVTGGGRGGGGAGGEEPGSFTIRVRVPGLEAAPSAPANPEPEVAPEPQVPAPEVAAPEIAAREEPAAKPSETAAPIERAAPLPVAPTTETSPDIKPGSGSDGGAGGGTGRGAGSHDGAGSDAPGLPAVYTPAILRSGPKPEYPAASVLRSEEGTVLCAMRVRADGRVESVEILRSSGHPRLDQAAIDALSRWTFEPARSDGAATTARVVHQVAFRLE